MQTDGQTNRQTDKQTKRQTDKQTNRQTDKKTKRQKDKKTNRQEDNLNQISHKTFNKDKDTIERSVSEGNQATGEALVCIIKK